VIGVAQRVLEARVVVDGQVIGQIQKGLLLLLCAEQGDTAANADKMLAKLLKLRIFSDEAGNRPSFTRAASPADGQRLYDYFVAQAKQAHPIVQTGQFAADMKVHLINDGPVTIPLQM
jgi:D-tyrosyl-tRNA(Tyr) deacylase